jgi:hypothetical protein
LINEKTEDAMEPILDALAALAGHRLTKHAFLRHRRDGKIS